MYETFTNQVAGCQDLGVSGPLLLRAGRTLLDGRLQPGVDVLVADGALVAVGSGLAAGDARVLEAAVLAPGFVDLHVHALEGSGLVGSGAPDLEGLSRALARRGVTGFLATTIAQPVDELLPVLALARVRAQDRAALPGARCLGVHLEGPWLAPDRAGAQPPDALCDPDLDDLDRLLSAGPPALVTIAPELPGALPVIAAAAAAGVVVSLGHSAATYEQAATAVAAGARHVTHCFNAMAGLHHREPGLVGLALDHPGLTVEAIADGVHLHPAMVRLLWRLCGPARVCLVSDAVDIDLPGGPAARLADGTLAGSRIGLDAAVRNLVSWDVPLADALTMASTTPARVVGRAHGIVAGGPADLVLLDDELEVLATVVGGAVAWQR